MFARHVDSSGISLQDFIVFPKISGVTILPFLCIEDPAKKALQSVADPISNFFFANKDFFRFFAVKLGHFLSIELQIHKHEMKIRK